MPEHQRTFLGQLERWGTAAENAALVLLLGGLMLLAVGQIVMRIFFNAGFVWMDEFLKLMVLWIALIASVAASRSGRHLRIDVLSHFMPERLSRLPMFIAEGFAAGICGTLAWQSMRFVKLSYEFGDTVLVDTPAWLAHGIMPIAFGLMSYRFLLSMLREAVHLLRPVVTASVDG
ncbi:MAG: TRAP transporter small permease [Halioglobus sp.]|nr:TRAP transporter small permease [Halioglobus sp.]